MEQRCSWFRYGRSPFSAYACREADLVKTTKHNIGLSQQVHRIGHHFPSSVVGRACLSLGIDLSRSGHVLRQHELWRPERQDRKKKGLKLPGKDASDSKLSQAVVDTQAREAIRDLFPKIPEQNMHEIIQHAFELVSLSRSGS